MCAAFRNSCARHLHGRKRAKNRFWGRGVNRTSRVVRERSNAPNAHGASSCQAASFGVVGGADHLAGMLRKLFVCVAGALLVLSVRNARASSDVDDDNWRPDVLRCEEAVAKLVACCPRFATDAVTCTHEKVVSTSGCDEWTTTTRVTPALDEAESACVIAASCTVLVDSGVCARAATAQAYVDVSQSSIDSPAAAYPPSTHAPVCP